MIDEHAIPTIAEWGDYEADLDTKWTFDKFNQKNFAEAAALFASCASATCEDLGYMPLKPFQYYMTAITRYISSEGFKNTLDLFTDDAIYFFFCRVVDMLGNKPDFILPIWHDVDAALTKIAAMKPQKFCADCDDEPENYDLVGLAELQDDLLNVRLAYDNAKQANAQPSQQHT